MYAKLLGKNNCKSKKIFATTRLILYRKKKCKRKMCALQYFTQKGDLFHIVNKNRTSITM